MDFFVCVWVNVCRFQCYYNFSFIQQNDIFSFRTTCSACLRLPYGLFPLLSSLSASNCSVLLVHTNVSIVRPILLTGNTIRILLLVDFAICLLSCEHSLKLPVNGTTDPSKCENGKSGGQTTNQPHYQQNESARNAVRVSVCAIQENCQFLRKSIFHALLTIIADESQT